MDDYRKVPRCQKCGKLMKEIIYRKRVIIPFQVMLNTLCFGVHPIYFWYFRCPEKHMGAVLIPVTYTEGNETMKRKYYVVK